MLREVINYESMKDGAVHDAFISMLCQGAAIVPNFLSEGFRGRLLEEVEGHAYSPAREELMAVRQNFDHYAFKYNVPAQMWRLTQLKLSTELMVRGLGPRVWANFKNWNAIDIVVQKYGPDSFLTAHKDLDRHPLVIVIYTIAGSCSLEVLDGREGQVVRSFTPKAGDLLLLLANNPHSSGPDARPFHRVSGSLTPEPRISVTFRDNLRPELEIPGFAYEKVR